MDTLPGSMRERFFKVRATEMIAKDDWAVVDLEKQTVMRNPTGFKTSEEIVDTVVKNVKKATDRVISDLSPQVENVRKLTDREMLFICLGALGAISYERPSAKTLVSQLEKHLYPDRKSLLTIKKSFDDGEDLDL